MTSVSALSRNWRLFQGRAPWRCHLKTSVLYYRTNVSSVILQDLHKSRPLVIPSRHLETLRDRFIPRHKRDKVDPTWKLVYEDQYAHKVQYIVVALAAGCFCAFVERIYNNYKQDKEGLTSEKISTETDGEEDTASKWLRLLRTIPQPLDSTEKSRTVFSGYMKFTLGKKLKEKFFPSKENTSEKSDSNIASPLDEKLMHLRKYVYVVVFVLQMLFWQFYPQRVIVRMYMSPNEQNFVAMLPRYLVGLKKLHFNTNDCVKNSTGPLQSVYRLKIKEKPYVVFDRDYLSPSYRYKLMKVRD